MSDTIETLRVAMEAAARDLDFEGAKRLRDRISLMRGGASAIEAAEADVSGLSRQRPGAMGLGTSRQRVTPPPNWKPPVKPAFLSRDGRPESGDLTKSGHANVTKHRLP